MQPVQLGWEDEEISHGMPGTLFRIQSQCEKINKLNRLLRLLVSDRISTATFG